MTYSNRSCKNLFQYSLMTYSYTVELGRPICKISNRHSNYSCNISSMQKKEQILLWAIRD
uniref:Retrovirus-related Pol polyprotein from transposon 297 family n=1 Tax=Rhizophora mucronata TaxID=61149 RepID=A0A2P2JHE3_RHIMU